MNSLITVVIPAYNAGHWIEDALKSVMAQQDAETRIIVVDDGSTDDTCTIVRKYRDVRYVYKPNGGQASARNCGIRIASTKYIAFLDADDLWLPHKTYVQLREMVKAGAKWSFTDALVTDASDGAVLYRYNKSKRLAVDNIFNKLTVENVVPSPSVIVDRSVLQGLGGFDERNELRNREDWDMWLRLSEQELPLYIAEPLVRYRIHQHNSTRVESVTAALGSALTVINMARQRRHGRDPMLFRRAEALQYLHASRLYRKGGQKMLAVAMARRAIGLLPLMYQGYIGMLWAIVPIWFGEIVKRKFSATWPV